MQFLGVDIGSSTIKGAVLDVEKGELGPTARVAFPDPLRGTGGFEVGIREVVAGVRKVLNQLLESAPDAEAALFCGQMGGVLLVDDANRPLTNYLSWRDLRTLAPHPEGGTWLDAIRRRWSDGELAAVGNELQPGSAASLLFWLRENAGLPAAAIPLTLGDYVLAELCGSRPATEPTHALGTLNLASGAWHRAALDRLGLGELRWPPLVPWNQPVGTWNSGSRRLKCFPVVGDQQAALRGAMLDEGELSLNVSTGSQVSLLTRELQPGDYQTRPWFDGAYLNTITHLPAGRALNVLVDLLTELPAAQRVKLTDSWAYIARAAEQAPESDLDVRLSFFAGPMGKTGGIGNIAVDNLTVGSLFRAAFRNMADNYWVCAERLSPARDWRRIVLTGGLVDRLPPLRRAIQDRFGSCEFRERPAGEDTLLGLLALAQSL